MSNEQRAASESPDRREALAAMVIATPNLELVAMTREFLGASLEGRTEAMRAALSATPAPEWPDDRKVTELWLSRAPAAGIDPWGPRAVILRSERRMIGHAGFHSPPGPDYLEPYAPGGIELGYTVYKEYRGHGFAVEAVRGLIAFAAERGARKFVVSISPSNGASLAVAGRLGFTEKVGSHDDPDEGIEDIYVFDLDSAPAGLG